MLIEILRHWLAFNRTVKETFQLQRELQKARSQQVCDWFIDTLRDASTDIEKEGNVENYLKIRLTGKELN